MIWDRVHKLEFPDGAERSTPQSVCPLAKHWVSTLYQLWDDPLGWGQTHFYLVHSRTTKKNKTQRVNIWKGFLLQVLQVTPDPQSCYEAAELATDPTVKLAFRVAAKGFSTWDENSPTTSVKYLATSLGYAYLAGMVSGTDIISNLHTSLVETS